MDPTLIELWHSRAFMGTIKVFWLSQFIRYIMRPQKWFSETLKRVTQTRLRRLSCNAANDIDFKTCDYSNSTSCCQTIAVNSISKPFVSLHVRYGTKIIEQPSQPLDKYMKFLTTKVKHIKDVYLSTETESVIQTLAEEYPEYSFYYLHYDRVQDLNLGVVDPSIDYVQEFLLSFTNLYIAIEATAFVGSLTSSWCVLIHQLERTRGDGGADYWSVDIGSQYTSCF